MTVNFRQLQIKKHAFVTCHFSDLQKNISDHLIGSFGIYADEPIQS